LIAARRDGRLVVIELKVSEDREHVPQGADYWRRGSAPASRTYHARPLFGEMKIRDEPPLLPGGAHVALSSVVSNTGSDNCARH
jgi:hypothetical protein